VGGASMVGCRTRRPAAPRPRRKAGWHTAESPRMICLWMREAFRNPTP
jgi:hypothetical protein